MSTFQGFGGLMVMGGVQDGTTRLNGALASGAATLALDDNGTGTLTGIILGGDTFTIAGETGSPTHTITAGAAFVIAGASVTSVTFTPAIAVGGVADNATLTFAANSVSQIRGYDLTVEQDALDNSAFGDRWESRIGGLARWEATFDGFLDLADTKQGSLASCVASATPNLTALAFTFRITTSKQFYGYGVPDRMRLLEPHDGLVGVQFHVTGDGTVLKNYA